MEMAKNIPPTEQLQEQAIDSVPCSAIADQPPSEHVLLVVDDNPTNLGVISDYLEGCGFKILVARDGESALQKAQLAHPDLILLDVMMPGIDGFETCRRLKASAETREIPVIFMTALSSAEEKVRGFEAGAVDYVTKPLYQEEVLARVTTHLRIRDLTRSLQRFNQELEQLVQQRTAELRQAYWMLEKLDKSKADFIDVAAHELRTPLTLILGYARLLLENLPPGDVTNRALLEGIIRGENRLHEIVNNLLDLSRIANEALEVHKAPTSLADIVRCVHNEFAPALRERNLTFTTVNLEQLPIIQADTSLLSKVFYHLIMNAIKYTPDGGSITVSGRCVSEDIVEIVVSDTGIGIDPLYHRLIFEKFFQLGEVALHSSGKTRFKSGGPGLGLPIARGIVQAHGGRIWVESEGYDEQRCPGSHFHVCLPIR